MTKNLLETIFDVRQGKSLNEASNVTFDELSKTSKSQVKKITKVLRGVKFIEGFSGISGEILIFSHNSRGSYRFNLKELKTIAQMDIRWLEAGDNYISVGV